MCLERIRLKDTLKVQMNFFISLVSPFLITEMKNDLDYFITFRVKKHMKNPLNNKGKSSKKSLLLANFSSMSPSFTLLEKMKESHLVALL